MKAIFFGAAALAALACSATVFAEPGSNADVRSVAVRYADVNANSSQGAETLYARLKAAAKSACGTAPGLDLASRHDFNTCRADALGRAVSDVNSRALTALHRSSMSPIELARFDSALIAR